mgnify:FL=1
MCTCLYDSVTVEETTIHDNRDQLCLPQRVHYPKFYIECLVIDTRALKEYVITCQGRRQGAAAVKLNIPCKSDWERDSHTVGEMYVATISARIPKRNAAVLHCQSISCTHVRHRGKGEGLVV